MGTDEEIEVSEADHEAGFKVIPIFYKASGKPPGSLRLTAPSHRVALEVYTQWTLTGGGEALVKGCLPVDANPEILDKLTLASAAQVQLVCIALCFGDEVLKKNRETGKLLLDMYRKGTISAKTSSSASPPDIAPGK
jgi:hypothetical protein